MIALPRLDAECEWANARQIARERYRDRKTGGISTNMDKCYLYPVVVVGYSLWSAASGVTELSKILFL